MECNDTSSPSGGTSGTFSSLKGVQVEHQIPSVRLRARGEPTMAKVDCKDGVRSTGGFTSVRFISTPAENQRWNYRSGIGWGEQMTMMNFVVNLGLWLCVIGKLQWWRVRTLYWVPSDYRSRHQTHLSHRMWRVPLNPLVPLSCFIFWKVGTNEIQKSGECL